MLKVPRIRDRLRKRSTKAVMKRKVDTAAKLAVQQLPLRTAALQPRVPTAIPKVAPSSSVPAATKPIPKKIVTSQSPSSPVTKPAIVRTVSSPTTAPTQKTVSKENVEPVKETKEQQKPEKFKISFTKLTSYLDCPQRYRLQYVERKRQLVNVHMIFGRALHEAIAFFAQHYMYDDKLTDSFRMCSLDHVLKQFTDELEKGWKELPNTGESIEYWREKGTRILKEYYYREKSVMFDEMVNVISDASYEYYDPLEWESLHDSSSRVARKPIFVEEKFDLPIKLDNVTVPTNAEVTLTGYFDRVDVEYQWLSYAGQEEEDEQESVVVVEYKTNLTGTSEPEYDENTLSFSSSSLSTPIEKHLLQLKLYIYAYSKVYNLTPNKGYITSITTGDSVVYETKEEDLKAVEKMIQTTAAAILNDTRFEAKPSKSNCNYCSFKDSCSFRFRQ